ncbi:MAG: hypothetical protein AAF900_01775 [Bacteroidota bacterium]
MYIKKHWTYFFYIFSLCFILPFIGHVRAVVEIELTTFKASNTSSDETVQDTQGEDHNSILRMQSDQHTTESTDTVQQTEIEVDESSAIASASSFWANRQLDDGCDSSTDSDDNDSTEEELAISPIEDDAIKVYEDLGSEEEVHQMYNLLYSQKAHTCWWQKEDNQNRRSKAFYCEYRGGNNYIITIEEYCVVFMNMQEELYFRRKAFFVSESYIETQQCKLKITQSAASWHYNAFNYTFADPYTNATHKYVKCIGQDNLNQFIRFTKEASAFVAYNVVYKQNGKHLLSLQIGNADTQSWWYDGHNKSLQKANTYKLKGQDTTLIEGYQQYALISITDNKPSLININTTFARTITIGAQENRQIYFVPQFAAENKSLYLYNPVHHHLEALEGWVYCQDKHAIEEQADNNAYINNNTEAQVVGLGGQDYQASNNILFYDKDRQGIIYLVLGQKDKNGIYKTNKHLRSTLYTTDKQDKYSAFISGHNPEQLLQGGAKYFQIDAKAQTYTLSCQARGDQALASDSLVIWYADAYYTLLFDARKQEQLHILNHRTKTVHTVLAPSSLIHDHRLRSLALSAERRVAILVANKHNPEAKSIYTAFANKDKAHTPLLRKASTNIKGNNMHKFTLKDAILLAWHDDDNALDIFTRRPKEDTLVFDTWKYTPTAEKEHTITYTGAGFFPSKVDARAWLKEEGIFCVKSIKVRNWWFFSKRNWIFEKNDTTLPFVAFLFDWQNLVWASIVLILISNASKLVHFLL